MQEEDPRCLVVEDDPDAARIAADFLRMEGYACTIAATGEEALKLFADHDWDLVFLDIQLPGLGGPEVASVMRRVEGKAEVPIIVASAIYRWSSPQAQALRDLGAIAFLAKPFSRREVAQAVEMVRDFT